MNRLLSAVAGLVAVVAVFLLGGYVEYTAGFPFAQMLDRPAVAAARTPPPSRNTPVSSVPSTVIPPSSPVRTDVPIVSRAQGAQDAARADTPMGETIDLQRCYATMIARKLIESEARTVCAKIISGISH